MTIGLSKVADLISKVIFPLSKTFYSCRILEGIILTKNFETNRDYKTNVIFKKLGCIPYWICSVQKLFNILKLNHHCIHSYICASSSSEYLSLQLL